MNDSWDERRKAIENEYFEKKNQEALERIGGRKVNDRKSPITGEPMETITIMGVAIDQCPTSKGIWLDAGELEQILEASAQHEESERGNLLGAFFATLAGK